MDLYPLSEEFRRSLCKEALEALEFWLRRIIHDSLSKDFGPDYLNSKNASGDFRIKAEIRKNIEERKKAEPERYPRLIDASLLEHVIDIICNPELYNKYFSSSLKEAFPDGREEARTFLKRLEYPRNCLYHANPISIRLAEQVICYSHDIIDSLKEFYRINNMEREFNVPTVIKATDSFGNVFHFNDHTIGYNLRDKPEFHLRPGDTLTIELEIDPSFNESEYKLEWRGHNVNGNTKILVLKINDTHIRDTLVIECRVTSNKSWHKFGDFDHNFNCNYRVLPPLKS